MDTLPEATPALSECPTCYSPINPRAQLCPICKSYRKRWKNWLLLYGSGVGLFSAIAATLVFIVGQGLTTYRVLFGADALQTLYFEYPGEAAFLNVGVGDMVLQSLTLEWPGSNLLPHPVQIPISSVIRSGEILLVKLPSRFPEPDDIGLAEWIFGDPTQSVYQDAFAVWKRGRCSVFHVFSPDHPGLQLLRQSHLSDAQDLTTVTAEATLSLIRVRSGKPVSYTVRSPTAFLRVPDCRPGGPRDNRPGRR